MRLSRLKLQEVVRALCVVALIFLNFGHAPLAVGGEFVVAPLMSSFCGDPVDGPGEAEGHPCQACRIGTDADLPSLSCAETIESPRFAVLTYPETATIAEHPRRFGNAAPRAPPAV